MTITVRRLLDRPMLQLSLVGGESGLDREIIWAHASDLEAPWDYLGPGELLLTNGTGIGAAPAGQVHFADRLARNGATGMVIGLGTGGAPVTAELARRAGELGLPLLTVPQSVRFSDIVRTVAESNDGGDHEQVDVAQFYDLLRLSLAAGDLGAATFRALGRHLGLRLYLVDGETGVSVFDDEEAAPLGQVLARSVAEHGRAIPGLLRLSRDGGADDEVCALAVAVPGEQLTALIAEPVDGRLPSIAVLQHVAVAGAVQLAQLSAQRHRRQRQGAELLALLLDRHRGWRAASGELASDGLDLAASVLVALRAADPGTEDALDRRCARSRLASLMLRRDDLLYAVVPEGAAGRFLPLAAALGCPAGVSDPVGSADRIPDASTEAMWALGIAEANQIAAARYGDGGGLLMPRSPGEAEALVDQVLGPLLTYDRAHGTQYVETVRAFVRADRSWQQAAAGMHVHKQTLGYRLRKAEELTGRGFARTQHLAEWWFALQAFDLLAACRRP